MATINMTFSNIGSRNDVRKRVIDEFSKESPGSGKGVLASKYDYIVATLQNGNNVILTRPAYLKFGFDFVIRVSDTDFNPDGRRRDCPKLDEITADLTEKRNHDINRYTILYDYIREIFDCNIEVETIEYEGINFSNGYDSDMILHVIKWFFIEQDIRYWNYSGRNMFMSGVPIP